MFYWIHVSEGTQFTGYGPFGSESAMRGFRAHYADDEDEDGARRLVDDIPPLPGISNSIIEVRDNHETDSWIPLSTASCLLEILEGWPIYDPGDAYRR